jgi:RNA polymerase sigma factor (TIGR02999 family)
MNDVTQILYQIDSGDYTSADKLLALVYENLRQLAAARLAREKPGNTLQATALVHEAYLRLVDPDAAKNWGSRRYFFAAAATAMRRILVESARKREAQKRGGGRERVEFSDILAAGEDGQQCDLLALDEALGELQVTYPDKAQLIELRFFCGFSLEESAEQLGVSRATAQRNWAFARAWLYGRMHPE